MPNKKKSPLSFLKVFDIFGKTPGFNVDGGSYNSYCGALLSFLVLVLCLMFSVQKLQGLSEYQDTSIEEYDNKLSINYFTEKMNYNTTGLNVALAFIDVRTGLPVPKEVYQNYVSVRAQFHQIDSKNRSASIRTDLGLRPCT